MKLVLQNSSLKLRRVPNSVTFTPSDFENTINDSIIGGKTSSIGVGAVIDKINNYTTS